MLRKTHLNVSKNNYFCWKQSREFVSFAVKNQTKSTSTCIVAFRSHLSHRRPWSTKASEWSQIVSRNVTVRVFPQKWFLTFKKAYTWICYPSHFFNIVLWNLQIVCLYTFAENKAFVALHILPHLLEKKSKKTNPNPWTGLYEVGDSSKLFAV